MSWTRWRTLCQSQPAWKDSGTLDGLVVPPMETVAISAPARWILSAPVSLWCSDVWSADERARVSEGFHFHLAASVQYKRQRPSRVWVGSTLTSMCDFCAWTCCVLPGCWQRDLRLPSAWAPGSFSSLTDEVWGLSKRSAQAEERPQRYCHHPPQQYFVPFFL